MFKKKSVFLIIVILVVTLCGILVYSRCNRKSVETKNTAVKTNSNESGLPVEYKELGIKKYKYPQKFTMGKNLKGAIENMMFSYNHFSEEDIKKDGWSEHFVARFLTNSRYSFDYLDSVRKKSKIMSIKEANYTAYSLTGKNIKLDIADKSIDINDTASFYENSVYRINDYTCTDEGEILKVKAKYEEESFRTESVVETGNIDIVLKKNPYSCFDGYSIISFNYNVDYEAFYKKISGKTFVFEGSFPIVDSSSKSFEFEKSCWPEGVDFGYYATVNFSTRPELLEYVLKNQDKRFRITYSFEEVKEHNRYPKYVVPEKIEIIYDWYISISQAI